MSRTTFARCIVGLGVALAVLLASASAGAVKATMKWDPNPASDNITGYEVHYDIRPGPPYAGTLAVEGPSPIDVPLAALADPANPSFDLHGLPSCHPLYFNLKAYRDEGDQRVSSEFTGEISAKVPYRPQWVEATAAEDGSVVIRWDGFPSGDEGTIDHYVVYYSTATTPPEEEQLPLVPSLVVSLDALQPPHAPAFPIADLAPASPMVHLAVAAECATGERRVSEISTVTIERPPLPSDLTGALGCQLGRDDDEIGAAPLLPVLWLSLLLVWRRAV